jgi:acyl-CoA synthetase (AMP-forming)/AMP-acid ligase II
LKDHPDVADAIVVGLPDERFGEQVVALVQARPGRTVDAAGLSAHAHTLLTGYKVPRRFVLVDEVVRSPSGKPDYPHARSVAEARAVEGREAPVAPTVGPGGG